VLRGAIQILHGKKGKQVDMITKNIFELTKDVNNVKLKELFKDNVRLKEIHIDTYTKNPLVPSSTPFMLMLRLIEKNIIISNNNKRLILKKNINGNESHYMNILFSEITECYYRITEYYSEFILNIQNIYYVITIFN
jgi:hypothetical protein